MLDLLDSLVRKSLITVEETHGRGRYGMLETIRQFAEEQLVASGDVGEARDAHTSFFAAQAQRRWETWDGPRYRESVDWFEDELDNLRAAFRWAAERDQLDVATSLAAHSAMLGQSLQAFEPVGWCEELLGAATDADVLQLPRLHTAASLCLFQDRPDDALRHAHRAVALEQTGRYDPFPSDLSRFREANTLHFIGDLDGALAIFSELAAQPGQSHVRGAVRAGLGPGRVGPRRRGHRGRRRGRLGGVPAGQPVLGGGCTRAARPGDRGGRSGTSDGGVRTRARRRRRPTRPIRRRGAADRRGVLAAVSGDPIRALSFYRDAIDAMHRSGEIADVANVTLVFASLASTFELFGRHGAAATLCGVIHGYSPQALGMSGELRQRLRARLGDVEFDDCVALGSAMQLAEAVRFVRAELVDARGDVEPCLG